MTIDNSRKNEAVWYHKYQPQKVEDCILPDEMKKSLDKAISSDTVPNLAFFSFTGGTGKSATVNSILKDLNSEAMWINASLENGIDTLRGKILNFASQQSFDDKRKVVVLDEIDNMSSNSQMGMRGFVDEFSTNCSFIITGNYKDKIIPQLLQRFETYEFETFAKSEMVRPIFERLSFILTNEQKEFNPKDLVSVINTYYPSIRSMVGALQKYSTTGTLVIPEGELDNAGKFETVIDCIAKKKFNDMIDSVNNITAPSAFFGWAYKNMNKYFEKENLPKAVMIFAKYQDYDTRAVDKSLNMAACCTELMMQTTVKV